MSVKIIGYRRISTRDQRHDRQLEGIATDKIFDDVMSGIHKERPQLKALLDYVREGDRVVVHSLDRLARNLDDLRSLITTMNDKGVEVHFITENLTFTGQAHPLSQFLLAIVGAFCEFERSILRERQREGIALAQKRGVYKGRKKKLNTEAINAIQKRLLQGDKKSDIARDFSISRETLYRYIIQEITSPKKTIAV